jgi:hypothetical protein
MFLTEEKARARLSSASNLANRFGKHAAEKPDNVTEITLNTAGRNKGTQTISQETRDEIALRTKMGEPHREICKDYGIVHQAVTEIAVGRAGKVSKNFDSVLSEVRDRALERLMSAMGLISDDKLSGCSAKDLSSIAANMSRVVERTIPNGTESGTQVNVVIYSPEPRQEKYYKTVEI